LKKKEKGDDFEDNLEETQEEAGEGEMLVLRRVLSN